jgi:hypothetical protein
MAISAILASQSQIIYFGHFDTSIDLTYNRLEKLGLTTRQRYLCQRQKLQELIKHKLIS